MNPDRRLADHVRHMVHAVGDQVSDLHLWRLGPGHLGAIVCVKTETLREATSYREKLSSFTAVSHLTVEIVRSADAKAASAPIRAYICGRMAEVLAISRYDKLFTVYPTWRARWPSMAEGLFAGSADDRQRGSRAAKAKVGIQERPERPLLGQLRTAEQALVRPPQALAWSS